MLISYIFHNYDLRLMYDNAPLSNVVSHKHLGIHIASNNKWTKHIDSIIDSASKQISYLRKLKYQLSKSTLDKLHCTYIRPLLEYCSEVLDGCNMTDANRLEQVQLNAARIVTGLPIFASKRALYYETGWKTLAERRKVRKLCLMNKIVNNDTPTYLNDLLPNRVNETNNYNLRNRNNFEIPFTRLCSFESSFFPSTLKLWNELDLETRTAPTFLQFKAHIKSVTNQAKNHITFGDRKLNIILTRIRHRCSSLRGDLSSVNIIPNSNCDCGAPLESAEHYFFECPLYTEARDRLFQSLNLGTDININFQLLTIGCQHFDNETNRSILLSVLRFLKDSHRFD